jgi:hypothetical protein
MVEDVLEEVVVLFHSLTVYRFYGVSV